MLLQKNSSVVNKNAGTPHFMKDFTHMLLFAIYIYSFDAGFTNNICAVVSSLNC